jgi:hypothetical protein
LIDRCQLHRKVRGVLEDFLLASRTCRSICGALLEQALAICGGAACCFRLDLRRRVRSVQLAGQACSF